MSAELIFKARIDAEIPEHADLDDLEDSLDEIANVMTLAKLINQLGDDSLDYTSLDGAIRGFKGPMMLQAGPLDCGNQTILGLSLFVSVCGKLMGVEQYKDGEWISVAMELTGNAIDATTL